MSTDSVSTAKCTSVRRLNSKIGSRGSRSCLYCRRASSTRWSVSGFFSSSVPTGTPFRLSVTSRGLLGAWREVELAGQSQAIRGIAGLEFRIQLVRRLEIRCMERSPIALEPVSQRRECAVSVHPLAQIAEDLLAGLVAVQRLQLAPLTRLGLADEGEHRVGEDRSLAVEAVAGDGNVAVLEQMRFDHGLEGGFGVPVVTRQVIYPPPRAYFLRSRCF